MSKESMRGLAIWLLGKTLESFGRKIVDLSPEEIDRHIAEMEGVISRIAGDGRGPPA